MKPLTYFVLLVMTISPSATFAQYQLVGKDGDRSALYFNTKLVMFRALSIHPYLRTLPPHKK